MTLLSSAAVINNASKFFLSFVLNATWATIEVHYEKSVGKSFKWLAIMLNDIKTMLPNLM